MEHLWRRAEAVGFAVRFAGFIRVSGARKNAGTDADSARPTHAAADEEAVVRT